MTPQQRMSSSKARWLKGLTVSSSFFSHGVQVLHERLKLWRAEISQVCMSNTHTHIHPPPPPATLCFIFFAGHAFIYFLSHMMLWEALANSMDLL